MSWIISRERAGEYQQYKDTWSVDGIGRWGVSGDGLLPLQYLDKYRAQRRMQLEAEKDPGWNYEINYYE